MGVQSLRNSNLCPNRELLKPANIRSCRDPIRDSDDRPKRGRQTARVGKFVITMSADSYARELWRFGEPDLARRAAEMRPSDCAAVGERAGDLSLSGGAERLWPRGPRGHTSVILLAVIEHLEGHARPCARARRLPEKSLPEEWKLSEEARWAELGPVSRAMDLRLRE